MIVADTSIWIECFRNPKSAWADKMRDLVLNENVAFNGIIFCEILQGARTSQEYRKLEEALSVLHFREVNRDVWDLAARVANRCQEKGQKIPLSDSIIAAQCLQYHDDLVSLDKHFSIIAKYFSALNVVNTVP